MTKLLEKTFNKVSKLPEFDQNLIAKWVLDEIESDEKWNKLFANSENQLAGLAFDALAEDAHGKSTLLNPDLL